MNVSVLALILKLFAFVLLCSASINSTEDFLDGASISEPTYTNTWVIHMKEGLDAAKELAHMHDFIFHGQLGNLEHYYHLEHKHVKKRSRRSADSHHTLLEDHPKVLWVEQQVAKSRRRRGYFNDPLFEHQWYLKNQGQTRERCLSRAGAKYQQLDIDVEPSWFHNITGNGVVVSILDDGIEYTHPDLLKNFDKYASFDYNNNDPDPIPRYSDNNINKHGTRCAGEVAAEKDNGICGVGVAYNAKVGGIRMLDGDVTDAVEAGSLSFRPYHIDIYSSSWGPDDDGRTVDGPGTLALKAFKEGVEKGRNGLGSIFVWATGNGGRYSDYCSCDGYINSPYTISIGAVDNCGLKPWYSEACPGTLAVTYSSGETTGKFDRQISTTDLHGKCTGTHTGTSAAAPLAAGIFALVLEANRKLTWRDIQHLIVHTSKVVSPNDVDWQENHAGHMVNPKFGFGVLDTNGLVKMATSKDWKTARRQHTCQTHRHEGMTSLHSPGTLVTYITTDACKMAEKKCVTKLEHVHVKLSIKKRSDRGQLSITLTSPQNTKSLILKKRVRDTDTSGFEDWTFLTVFHWDESPKGKWKLSITDESHSGGSLIYWYLIFYGTCDNKINSPFKIRIDEEEVCGKVCKKGCPEVFSDKCYSCEQYCDCTIGQCVPNCRYDQITDNQLLHCKRSMEFVDYNNIESNVHAKTDLRESEEVMGLSLTAKFAIICLALVAISAMVAGIAYFAAKMPQSIPLAKGYHSVGRYPCSEVVEGDYETGDNGDKFETINNVKS